MTPAQRSPRPTALHIERHGVQGPPLMMVHGFGASGFTWRRWVPSLAVSYRVSVVDLKGFGASPKPRDARYSPHHHADALVHAIRSEDLEDLTLVGHSLGGGVSLLTALRLLDAGELDRIRCMVLLSSAGVLQPLPPFISAARLPGLSGAGLALLQIHWIVGWVLKAIVYDSACVNQEMIRGYAAPLADSDGRYGLLETAREIIPPDLAEVVARFPELHVPVHLLWGDDDRVVPKWVGLRLLEVLPDARMETLPRCGHLPHEEFPSESLALVNRFLHGRAAAP